MGGLRPFGVTVYTVSWSAYYGRRFCIYINRLNMLSGIATEAEGWFNMHLYDRIRRILSDHLDASIELQEALITWYMTHPEEYLRVERRMKEGVQEIQGESEEDVQQD